MLRICCPTTPSKCSIRYRMASHNGRIHYRITVVAQMGPSEGLSGTLLDSPEQEIIHNPTST